MDEGWVKLHREIISNPIFKKINACHYFIYCILKANHEPKKIIWNKKEMIIEKGSFITGRKKASEETGLSQQNIRTAQQTLINLGMLQKSTTKSTTKFTYLTVCNYEKYQGNKKEDNHQTNQQLTINQPSTNHKQELIRTKKNIYIHTGEFKNVKLTPEEMQKLKERYKDYEDRIETLSLYLKSKGDKYKSHYATILNWERKENKEKKEIKTMEYPLL